jgi:putative lipoic acid-binding regulatory protein
MTLTVRAESREMIDALYTELSRHEAILMVL